MPVVAPPDPVAATLDAQAQAQFERISAGNLVVRGTMENTDIYASYAMISDGPDSMAGRYVIGDVLPGGATLHAIGRRHVEVLTTEGIETLLFEASTASAAPVAPQQAVIMPAYDDGQNSVQAAERSATAIRRTQQGVVPSPEKQAEFQRLADED